LPEFEQLDVPIRIGVVSDTHLVNPERGIPDRVLDLLQGCDLILHAGDINRLWVLDELRQVAPVHAVVGNNDAPELQESLPVERYYKIGPHRIGLLHGHALEGRRPATARNVALDRMRGVVDCVIYGHSHKPEIEHREGMLMINPGSPTQPRWAPAATIAILDVGDLIGARLIEV
jgi:uncharacterized protein